MALLSGLLASACSVVGVRTTAEPPYQVVDHVGAAEIRRYASRLAADTVVDADAAGARSVGFRRLAGYIFGANHARDTIAMTAPVGQQPAAQQPAASGGTIAMTAPVAQDQSAGGGWRIRFFMPAGTTLQSLPQPNDSSVQLVTIPEETLAVLRFSGVASTEAVGGAQARLLQALDGSAWHPVSAPFAWFYDPPWTLPPLRRNEAVVTVSR